MIENSGRIILGDQDEVDMSHKNSKRNAKRHKYGKPSANYYKVAEKGIKAPANDNGGIISPKYKNILKVLVPLLLCLAFLAWF